MTREEAREFLLSIANKLGYIGVEDLTDRDGKRMIEAIKALEEPQWISCSERLPEEKDAGILKKLGTSKRSNHVLVTVDVKGDRMTDVGCTYDGVWHWDKKYAFPDWKVVAWKPFEEPWRGDAE